MFEKIVDTAETEACLDCLDRFVVQVYTEQMYYNIMSIYEFKDVVYSLYVQWDGNEKKVSRILRFCRDKRIRYIIVPRRWASEKVISKADAYGIKVFAHTVDDIRCAEELKERGVYGIYTDNITEEQFMNGFTE